MNILGGDYFSCEIHSQYLHLFTGKVHYNCSVLVKNFIPVAYDFSCVEHKKLCSYKLSNCLSSCKSNHAVCVILGKPAQISGKGSLAGGGFVYHG